MAPLPNAIEVRLSSWWCTHPFPGWAGAFRRASIESTHASRRDLPLTPTAVTNLRVDKFKPLIP